MEGDGVLVWITWQAMAPFIRKADTEEDVCAETSCAECWMCGIFVPGKHPRGASAQAAGYVAQDMTQGPTCTEVNKYVCVADTFVIYLEDRHEAM